MTRQPNPPVTIDPTALANGRAHAWIASLVNIASAEMSSSNLALTSAALWNFLTKMTAQERAAILGEYTTVLAMKRAETAANVTVNAVFIPAAEANGTGGAGKPPKGRRTKTA